MHDHFFGWMSFRWAISLRGRDGATTVDADETCSTAYHGWVITPTDAGCHVLTGETQQGNFFLGVNGRQHPGALYRYHQDWVECLARAAEAQAIKNAA